MFRSTSTANITPRMNDPLTLITIVPHGKEGKRCPNHAPMPQRASAPRAPAIATATTVRMRCIVAAPGPSTALLPQVAYHEVRYPSPALDPSLTPGALSRGALIPHGRFDGRLACPGGRDDRGRVRQFREGRAVGHLRDL